MAKTIEEISATYADNELKLVDKELAESGYSRHTKMKVHLFCGYDIEDACNHGANAALKEIESILDAPITYVVEIGWQGQLNDICGMIRQRINELKSM